jgi:hypothetical protein
MVRGFLLSVLELVAIQNLMDSLWRWAVTTSALTKVEQAILGILASYPDEEIRGRELRGRLRSRGFRRTAPAFVFTMMRLEDKGLVTCREEVRVLDEVEVNERYYSRGPGWARWFKEEGKGPA